MPPRTLSPVDIVSCQSRDVIHPAASLRLKGVQFLDAHVSLPLLSFASSASSAVFYTLVYFNCLTRASEPLRFFGGLGVSITVFFFYCNI